MAIFHLSAKIISRKAGRSATGAAAYRAGVSITDERTGEVHDYTRKGGVEHSEIIMPAGNDWQPTRVELWNAAEIKNKRADAQVAREFVVALPGELSAAERQRLAVDFAREIASRYSVAADVAIHAPSRHGDNRNHHAHILTTTNRVEGLALGNKARELDLVAHNMGGKVGQANEIDRLRERWADMTNERLRENGIDARVDHRSHAERGFVTAPSSHLGPSATGYERRTGQKSDKRVRLEAEAEASDLAVWRADEERRLTIDDPLIESGAAQAVRPAPVDRETQRRADAEAAARYRELARQELVTSQRQARTAWEAVRPMYPEVAKRQHEKLSYQLRLAEERAERRKPLSGALSNEEVERIEREVLRAHGEPAKAFFNAQREREAFEAKIAAQWIPRPGDKARLAELTEREAGAKGRYVEALTEIRDRQNRARETKYRREMEAWTHETRQELDPIRAEMAKVDPERASAAFIEWMKAKPSTPALDAQEQAEKAQKQQEMERSRSASRQQQQQQMQMDDGMEM